MGIKYRAPKGTHDVLPSESDRWQFIENRWRELCHLYGYREIRTPVFEETELFTRSVGETTDIVSKEMYTFTDKGGRSITLKPEGTAPVVRAYLEHSLGTLDGITKLYYIIPFFRYERPQKGRFRQAHQMGAEIFGVAEPAADAEILSLVMRFFQSLGFTKESMELHLNTLGCPVCKPAYRDAVQAFARERNDLLCATCNDRIERNPLRVLDCKSPQCQQVLADAPVIDPYLCNECREHFSGVTTLLDKMDLAYLRDNRLVRGLDYYNRTAFELQGKHLGSQNALCGGGRYDTLVEQIGGDPTPALGVGIGIERALLSMEEMGLQAREEPAPLVFVVYVGEDTSQPAFLLANRLRAAGIAADLDHTGRSLKAQMRMANARGARYALILGEDEAAKGVVTLRNLQTHEQEEVPLESIVQRVS
jgi:histidyl-tRNA synthetase